MKTRMTETWKQEVAPTHYCKSCGAFWRYWSKQDTGHIDSWGLCSAVCGACCDNVPMSDQIAPITLGQLEEYIQATRTLWLYEGALPVTHTYADIGHVQVPELEYLKTTQVTQAELQAAVVRLAENFNAFQETVRKELTNKRDGDFQANL